MRGAPAVPPASRRSACYPRPRDRRLSARDRAVRPGGLADGLGSCSALRGARRAGAGLAEVENAPFPPLGASPCGQSESIDDPHRHHGIDTDVILTATPDVWES
ncbi:hypothetical protein [Streptomyces sp. NPDC001811]